jgi:hypothetical protein
VGTLDDSTETTTVPRETIRHSFPGGIVAQGRGHSNQVLAHNRRPGHVAPPPCRCRQDALARRAYKDLKQEIGLGHYEGRWLAGLPSSRYTGNRSLRFPDLRKGEGSPLRTSFRRSNRKISPSQWLPTPRRPRSGRSAIPNSISTIRREFAAAIANRLQRRPHCVRRIPSNQR